MYQFNIITVILVCAFIIPMLWGIFKPFTRDRIVYSLDSLLDNVEFLAGILLSIYLTRKIFLEHDFGIYKEIYERIPVNIRSFLYGRGIMTYLVVVPLMLMFVMIFIRLLTGPLYRRIIYPLSNSLYNAAINMNKFTIGIVAALWRVPRSIGTVFILGLLINFYSYYVYAPELSRHLNESSAYQFLYNNAIQPLLNTNIAKQIPVIVNDSFRKRIQDAPVNSGENGLQSPEQLIRQLTGGNIRVIEYFNGVTLDEAIKSNAEIDETAKKVVGDEKNSKKKAFLIYKWITKNIEYDYAKVEKVSNNPRGVESGSIVAYTTRKGICFDYSSLYISMCRAVGVKVRLMTGLGYSGLSWGDHAWNQVYSIEENRWINVDTTFGTAANYFDKPDFSVDHKYDEVQGEW